MRPIIIGTAGHIDHGKSSLIRALTGTDPDRLAEEKQRGMTIDIGFAFLNENIAFIDVPGHEKFIKNMVTGASTIDTGLLVIAADDGIMPQTREHFDILRLLNVKILGQQEKQPGFKQRIRFYPFLFCLDTSFDFRSDVRYLGVA